MIFLAKNFSYKSAFVGCIMGLSIGLGMLNFNIALNLGLILAVAFGFKKNPTNVPVHQKMPNSL